MPLKCKRLSQHRAAAAGARIGLLSSVESCSEMLECCGDACAWGLTVSLCMGGDGCIIGYRTAEGQPLKEACGPATSTKVTDPVIAGED